MKTVYASLAVAVLLALNVSFSSTYSERTLSFSESTPLWKAQPVIIENTVADTLAYALEQAVWNNDREALLQVLKKDVDVNLINSTDGYAPLHWAVERGFSDIVAVLIEHGADVNKMTENAIGKDRTPLHIAAEYGDPDIVKQLLEAGADVNAKTDYGETPLHGVRVFVKNPEVVQLLIEAGSDVNAATVFGSTPLHSAAILGSYEVVSLLIESGASIQVNKRGLTPLHHAAQHGHEQVVEVFLSQEKVPIDRQTRNGDTALHLAAKQGHATVVNLLLKAGANPLTLNKFSKSPLAEAQDRSYSNVVELLSSAAVEKEEGL